MIIKINGEDLYIPQSLYDTAEQISDFILQTIKTKTKVNNQIQLLYAIFIALHVKTGDLLQLMDQNEVEILLRAWDKPPETTQEDSN